MQILMNNHYNYYVIPPELNTKLQFGLGLQNLTEQYTGKHLKEIKANTKRYSSTKLYFS